MKTISRLIILLMVLVFALSSCGKKEPSNTVSNNDQNPGQSDVQNKNEDKGSPDDKDSGNSGGGGDVLALLENPKVPANYTFERITESKQFKGTGYERVTRKDSKYLIETIPYEGPDQGKAIGYRFFDAETETLITYDVKNNNVTEQKGSDIGGPEEAYDLNLMYKSIMHYIPQDIMGKFREAGQEDVEGYPCRVFELSENGKLTLFVSKEHNIILKYIMEQGGVQDTFILRGFKAGNVTDDMVKLNYPADAKCD